MDQNIPRGYLTLEKALEHFGQRKYPVEWETEKDSSKQEFQQLLFEEVLRANIFTDGGNLYSLQSRIWLSVEAERIFETGRASTSVGNEYTPTVVYGRVLIKQSSIDALFDGDTDDPETGAEDPPAQTQPPHVELNLPDDESTPDDTREQAEEPPEPKKRGAKPKYLWNDFWREVVRIANTPDGLPQKQADLEKRMLNWCQRSWGDEPGLSTVREMLNKLEPYLGE